MACSLISMYFDSPQFRKQQNQTIKTLKIDPEICSILIFQKRVCDYFLHHILHMIFQEKFSHIIL